VLNADQLGGKPAAGYLETSADTVGRSEFTVACDPAGGTFIPCASLTISTAREGRLLVNAEAPFGSDGGAAEGTCRIQLGGATVPSTTVHPGLETGTVTSDTDNVGIGVTVVTASVAAGSHSLVLECNQTVSDIDYNDLSLSALAIVPG